MKVGMRKSLELGCSPHPCQSEKDDPKGSFEKPCYDNTSF